MGQKNWRQTKLSVFASQPPSGTINPTPYKCPVTKTKVVLRLSSRGSNLVYVQFPLMAGSFTIVIAYSLCTFSIGYFENFHCLRIRIFPIFMNFNIVMAVIYPPALSRDRVMVSVSLDVNSAHCSWKVEKQHPIRGSFKSWITWSCLLI